MASIERYKGRGSLSHTLLLTAQQPQIVKENKQGMLPDFVRLIKMILMKPPTERSKSDKETIKALLESIDSIREIKDMLADEQLLTLSNYCKLEVFDEMQTLCRHGEFSNSVYFLLEGSVAITSTNEEVFTRDNIKDTIMMVVRPGMVFGEIGVISRITRTASCVAILPKTTVMTIRGRTYNDMLSKLIAVNRQKKVNFLASIPLFDLWEYPKLSALFESMSACKVNLKYGTKIYNPGEYTGFIYMVASGQIEISYCQTKQIENEETERTGGLLKKLNSSVVPLLLLAEGTFLGEENHPKYSQDGKTVGKYDARVVSQHCEIYWIARQNLMQTVHYNNDLREQILYHFDKREKELSANLANTHLLKKKHEVITELSNLEYNLNPKSQVASSLETPKSIKKFKRVPNTIFDNNRIKNKLKKIHIISNGKKDTFPSKYNLEEVSWYNQAMSANQKSLNKQETSIVLPSPVSKKLAHLSDCNSLQTLQDSQLSPLPKVPGLPSLSRMFNRVKDRLSQQQISALQSKEHTRLTLLTHVDITLQSDPYSLHENREDSLMMSPFNKPHEPNRYLISKFVGGAGSSNNNRKLVKKHRFALGNNSKEDRNIFGTLQALSSSTLSGVSPKNNQKAVSMRGGDSP